MPKLRSFIKKYIPVWALVAAMLTLLSLVVYEIAIRYPEFADFINGTVSSILRAVLSYATYLLPISLFELILILLIPIVALVIFLAVRFGKNRAGRVKFLCSLVGVVSLLFTSYIYTLGVGYHTTELNYKLGVSNSPEITAEELYDTALLVREQVNFHSELISYEDGESRIGYGMLELSRNITDAYDKVKDGYPFFINFDSRAKPIMLSTVMSDAGITGIYSFFTGEPNINMDYPDYNLPFTVAHEFAHQRGISRENEANFMAFLVCINSEDPFIRYSGYLNIYEYLVSALYSTDKELYKEVSEGLVESARLDIKASSAVTRAHKDSWFNKLNDRLNDSYLKFNGTEGVVSYGYVVRLAVAYYKNK